MTDASERESRLAEQVLTLEAGADQSPEGLAAATERCFDRLCMHMIDLVGPIGFDVLVRRALFLAGRTHPFVRDIVVEVRPDSLRLQGLRAAVAGRDPGEVRDGLVSSLASFVALLDTFIGEDLAHRLIRQAWPTTLPERPESGGEGNRA